MTQTRLPPAVYTAGQVREMDRVAIEDSGFGGGLLMARAAHAAYVALRRRWPGARRVLVLCGRGNNGGDGLLVARQARLGGLNVHVLLLREPEAFGGEAARALEAARAAGVTLERYNDGDLPGADVVVDAMLGTGLDRPVEGAVLEAIEAINRLHGIGVLAVDIPSGLSANTGATLGAAVRADLTVTFIGLKLGLFTGAGPRQAGRVVFDDLGVPPDVSANVTPAALAMTEADRSGLLSPRARDAHKNHSGHLLVVGGDHGTAGAVRLAAEAGLRGGAGLVSVATRREHTAAMTQARPELMCRGVEVADDLTPLLPRATVVAVGPGLGQDEWGRRLWARLLDSDCALVVDADALNLLAADPRRRDDWILTPHPGEAGRLLGCDAARIQADRPAAVRELARRYGGAAVLKGAGTLVCAGDGPLYLCRAGNPGMAVGGMGDLLMGFIAALRAQGLTPVDAARLGAYVHARAGDLAAREGGERGLLPSDLLPWLRRLVNPETGAW